MSDTVHDEIWSTLQNEVPSSQCHIMSDIWEMASGSNNIWLILATENMTTSVDDGKRILASCADAHLPVEANVAYIEMV